METIYCALMQFFLFFLPKNIGRIVRWDERNKNYRVVLDGKPEVLESKTWNREVRPLSQGSTSACTGFATVGLLATEPFISDGRKDKAKYDYDLGIELYSRATELDSFGWTYPPEDKGSSVLGAMKAAKQSGFIKEYRWCLGLSDVLRTLSYIGPVVVGVDWYQGFYKPNRDGLIRRTGKVSGGHAVELIGIDVPNRLVWGVNSWGRFWGKCGRFCISFDDLGYLLDAGGDAVTVVR